MGLLRTDLASALAILDQIRGAGNAACPFSILPEVQINCDSGTCLPIFQLTVTYNGANQGETRQMTVQFR